MRIRKTQESEAYSFLRILSNILPKQILQIIKLQQQKEHFYLCKLSFQSLFHILFTVTYNLNPKGVTSASLSCHPALHTLIPATQILQARSLFPTHSPQCLTKCSVSTQMQLSCLILHFSHSDSSWSPLSSLQFIFVSRKPHLIFCFPIPCLAPKLQEINAFFGGFL